MAAEYGVESLRRAAQFVLVVLLITSLGAPVAACCQRCPKKTADRETVPSLSDQCSHPISHAPLGRKLEAATHRVACFDCSGANQPPNPALVDPDRTLDLSLADGEASVGDSVLVAALPLLPEGPPPMSSTSRQAVICTFLI
jgi:hypothetical protein